MRIDCFGRTSQQKRPAIVLRRSPTDPVSEIGEPIRSLCGSHSEFALLRVAPEEAPHAIPRLRLQTQRLQALPRERLFPTEGLIVGQENLGKGSEDYRGLLQIRD